VVVTEAVAVRLMVVVVVVIVGRGRLISVTVLFTLIE
jgi:hypothetical protein